DFIGDQETLQLLASAEKGSEQPLAEAIVAYATEQNVNLVDVDDFEAIPGHGIRSIISDKQVLVGTRKLMVDNNIDVQDAEQKMVDFETGGKTAILIAIYTEYRGDDAVADTVKDTASKTINQIKKKKMNVKIIKRDKQNKT